MLLHLVDVGEESLATIVGRAGGNWAKGSNAGLEIHEGGCDDCINYMNAWRAVGY